MNTSNKLYYNTDLTFNSVEDSNNGNLKVSGYGCHFNTTNLNNEIVDAKSFNRFFDMYRSNFISPLLNWEHDRDFVIGTVDNITSDETGLFFECTVNASIPFCKDNLIPNIKEGVIKSFSTEGVIEGGYDGIITNADGSWYIKNFILTDLAIVRHPADWLSEFSVANCLKNLPQQSKYYLFL